jgi:hypothetical protein
MQNSITSFSKKSNYIANKDKPPYLQTKKSEAVEPEDELVPNFFPSRPAFS